MIGTDVYHVWRAAVRGNVVPTDQHLPTGVGGADGHPQAGIYRMRQGGGYLNGVAQPLRWVPVKILLVLDAADPTTVRHKWEAGLVPIAVVGEGQSADAMKIWSRCLKRLNADVAIPNAIDTATYQFWMTHQRWPDDAPAVPITDGVSEPQAAVVQAVASADSGAPADTAQRESGGVSATAGDDASLADAPGIGHNSGADPSDVLASLMREMSMQEAAIEDWLKKEPDGEAAANRAANWKVDLRALEARVAEAFRIEKEPVLRKQQAIDEKWRGPKAKATAIVGRMTAIFNTIAKRVDDRKTAAAKAEADRINALRAAEHAARLRAQEEVERQRREKEEWYRQAAIAEGRTTPEALPAPVAEPPPPPPPPMVVAEPVRTLFGGASGARAGAKVAPKQAIINDWKAAAAHYAEALKVKEAVQKLADADAKKGICCPGATLGERAAA